jgi:hypothetical protein
MRLLAFLLLIPALAIPSLAGAERVSTGDGSFVVTNANGVITVQSKGLIFGQFDHGSLTVLEAKADANAAPTVSGAKMKLTGVKIDVVYSGSDVRFVFPRGKYTLRIDGSGIDISAVGKGNVQLTGRTGGVDNGSYTVNGGKPLSIGASVSVVATYGGTPPVTADKTSSNTTRS